MNGHHFNDNNVCDRCGLTLSQFEDRGKPACIGKRRDDESAPEDNAVLIPFRPRPDK